MWRGALLLMPICGCAGPENSIRTLFPEITIAPGALAFGDVPLDEVGTRELYVTNAGQAVLEVDLALDGDKVFDLGADAHLELAPSEDDQEGNAVPLTFAPVNFLDYTATLTIVSNDEQTPSLQVPLTGRGVDSPRPEIEVTPLTLDFGVVAQGSQLSDLVLIKNNGLEPLEVLAINVDGSDAFDLVSDPTGQRIAPGSDYPLIVSYTPTNDLGDNAVLSISSNDPDEVDVLLLGNGGGGLEYPEAIIACPGTAAPPEWISLDGSGSTDPLGGQLNYIWSLTLRPEGSQSYLNQLVTAETELWVDLGGDYAVQLVVVNQQGTASEPAVCAIDAVPADELHVELTWDVSNHDLDLHVLENTSAELFDVPADCTFCNKNPPWGEGGAHDDPRLDLDDRSDGPENTNIFAPAAGTYPVKVHYYAGTGPTTATVTVYTYGQEIWSGSRVLKYDEVWDVGRALWPEGEFSPDATDVYTPSRRSCR